MKLLKRILLLVLGICWLSTHSQNAKLYSTDNGLSNSLINQIYQDKQGYIWIATEYGLNKFDGINFTIYTHREGDSLSLKNNYVRTLFEDKDNRLWVGTMQGLMRYDRETNTFENIKMWLDQKIVDPHVTSIIQATDGLLWITTSGQGIFTYNPTDNQCTAMTQLSASLSSLYLNLIYEDSDGTMWIGSENDGLNRYCRKNKQITIYQVDNGKINSNKISGFIQDRSGNLFAGTLTNGLNKYNPTKDLFERVDCTQGSQPLFVSSLMIGKQNQLYIGTDGQGLKIYDSDMGILQEYKMNYTLFDFEKGKIHAIFQDKDLNMWLGLFQKGIVFIPAHQNRFGYMGYKQLKNNPIGSSCVTAIRKDNDGTTWVGTDNDGIYGVNSRGERTVHFYQNSQPSSVPNIVHSLYEDMHQQLWIGSYAKGLAKLNKHSGECRYIEPLNGEKVYCVSGDNSGNLLVGTYGSGFYIMDIATEKLEHHQSSKVETDNLQTDNLPNNWINCIVSDSNGLIWIGHYKGLSCFDPKRRTFINDFGKNNLLPGKVVLTLFEDKNKNIWIGTTTGLSFFDTQHQTLTNYTTSNGLANDVICGITQDKLGNLWISTYHGISKYDPLKNEFTNYYANDGLQGNEFSRNAVFRDNEGKVFFGGINGITSFYPNEITDSNKKLNVLITQFYRFNQPVKKGDQSGNKSIVNTAVSDADTFTLSYRDNTFAFQFSTLQYTAPERILYQYRMEGINPEWISTVPGIDKVTYNNLPPGKYIFRFRAYDGQRYSDERSVLVIITPPWYQTAWAYAAYISLFLLLLYGVRNYILARIRYRHERREKEQAEKINEAKLQFFINISHEIRTPMTLVINPLQKLLSENTDPSKYKTYTIMQRNAQRILRLLNQLMDMRKIDKGQMGIRCQETDLIGFIEDLMLTFENLAQDKQIDFSFVYNMPELKVWIDLEQFDKVVLNILSNAFKYTPEGGEIKITVQTGEKMSETKPIPYFEISITDTGMGIDEEKIEKIFERFYQINNHPQSSFGTGIGLHIAYLFVMLHQGLIFAENRANRQGSRFVIRIPLGKEHLTSAQLADTSTPPRPLPSHPMASTIESDDKIPSTDKRSTRAKTNHRLLIVEDEDEIRNYIQEELSDRYKVTTCRNGKEAIELILKERYDLVISDVMMPNMDGITLCRKIKQNININHIPVILLTAKSKSEHKIEGLDTGADAYIVKPYDGELLIHTIDNLIDNRSLLRNKFAGNQDAGEKLKKIELKSHDEELINKIISVINDNLSNPSLNVEMIASHIGMSRVHLHRKLKELTSQSARDFIKNIRLTQAVTLLADKKFSISEVAYAVGFTNLSHFSNSFKEFQGVSPSEYVAQNQTNKASE